MTTLAKKAGGPAELFTLVGVGGYVFFRGVEIVAKKVYRKFIEKMEEEKNDYAEYIVKEKGEDNHGLKFDQGDIIHILEIDGDAVLISKEGDPDNPYIVSADLLREITDFNYA